MALYHYNDNYHLFIMQLSFVIFYHHLLLVYSETLQAEQSCKYLRYSRNAAKLSHRWRSLIIIVLICLLLCNYHLLFFYYHSLFIFVTGDLLEGLQERFDSKTDDYTLDNDMSL